MDDYRVVNVYGIAGESTHKTPKAALMAAGKREGTGWIVLDDAGNQWDNNGGAAVIMRRADER